jgi:hypothetical protein
MAHPDEGPPAQTWCHDNPTLAQQKAKAGNMVCFNVDMAAARLAARKAGIAN